MDWTQVLAVIGSNLALFIWARTEANQDRRQFLQLHQDIQNEMKAFREMWSQESKEFHGRLISIEEKKIQLLTEK